MRSCRTGLDSESHLDVLLGKGDKGQGKFRTGGPGQVGPSLGRLDHDASVQWAGNRTLPETNSGNLGEYGLFNLAEDPAQQHNLAADFPQLLDSLKAVFLEETDGYFRLDVKRNP